MPKKVLAVVDKVWESWEMVWKAVGKTKVWAKLGNVIQMEEVRYAQVIRRGVDENRPL